MCMACVWHVYRWTYPSEVDKRTAYIVRRQSLSPSPLAAPALSTLSVRPRSPFGLPTRSRPSDVCIAQVHANWNKQQKKSRMVRDTLWLLGPSDLHLDCLLIAY